MYCLRPKSGFLRHNGEEAKRNIRQAIDQHLASMLAHAQPVPQDDRLVRIEELTVAVPQ